MVSSKGHTPRDREAKQKALEVFLSKKAGEEQFEWSTAQKQEAQKSERFIITCAQNNTEIHRPFWEALKRYSDVNESELLVIPARYKNPTSQREPQDKEMRWPAECDDHYVESEVWLHGRLKLMGHARVQATAVNPLSGFAPLTQGSSAIFGHAQVSMQTVPTPADTLPAIMHTTGSVSRKNYSKTKAGIKAEFHHTLGAVIVEKRGKYFHMRHVCAMDNGSFFDLDRHYTTKGHKGGYRLEGLVTGDEHCIWMDEEVRRGTYGEGGLCELLRPKVIVRHDVLDSYAISHHHRRNAVLQWAKQEFGLHRIQDELEVTCDHIEATTPPGSKNIIVASNHHDHLTRWLAEIDIRREPWNAEIYHELSALVLKHVELGQEGVLEPDAFALWAGQKLGSGTIFAGRDDPITIKDILVSLHGDKGPNGARGSRRNLADIGVRTIIGHTHSSGICRGCYQVGTSARSMAYALGSPSGWMVTHCGIAQNGKRQLYNIMPDGSFHGRP